MYSKNIIAGFAMILVIIFICITQCTAILIVNGISVNEIPADSKTFFQKYPSLKDINKEFSSIPVTTVQPAWSLYLTIREMAVVASDDKSNHVIGSGEATSCIILVLTHSGSGVIGVIQLESGDHIDIEQGITDLKQKVLELSGKSQGNLEFRIVGGYCDPKNEAEPLFIKILHAVHKQSEQLNLKLACVLEPNTVVQNGVNKPIVNGVGVDVKTGNIYPADFSDKGADLPLRDARLIHGDKNKNINIYDNGTGFLTIGPFTYEPLRNADEWLMKSDKEFLKTFSTTPEVEKSTFVSEFKAAMKFLKDNPDSKAMFPDNKPHLFKRDCKTGLWVPV